MDRTAFRFAFACRLVAALALLALPGAALAQEESSEASTSTPSAEATGIRGSHGLMDASDSHPGSLITIYAFPNYWYGFGVGVGARYGLTLMDRGFIPSLNDSFQLEFGADAWFAGVGTYSYVGVSPLAQVRWTFHILPKLSAYATAGVGAWFPIGTNIGPYLPLYYVGGVGGIYEFSSGLWLRAEATSGRLLVGVGIPL